MWHVVVCLFASLSLPIPQSLLEDHAASTAQDPPASQAIELHGCGFPKQEGKICKLGRTYWRPCQRVEADVKTGYGCKGEHRKHVRFPATQPSFRMSQALLC